MAITAKLLQEKFLENPTLQGVAQVLRSISNVRISTELMRDLENELLKDEHNDLIGYLKQLHYFSPLTIAAHNDDEPFSEEERTDEKSKQIIYGYLIACHLRKLELFLSAEKDEEKRKLFARTICYVAELIEESSSLISIYYLKGYITSSQIVSILEELDKPVKAERWKNLPEKLPDFTLINTKLDELKESDIVNKIKAILIRLKDAENSWNPYWIGSQKKLNAIIDALSNLDEFSLESLRRSLSDHDSSLNLALNRSRLFPITFSNEGVKLNCTRSLMIARCS